MSVAARTREAGRTVRAVVDLVRGEEVTFLAAAIAYYAFVSLLPALLLAVAVASAVGGDALAARVVAASGGALSPSGEEGLADALAGARGRGGATLVGASLLAWSALRVFRGLDVAFSRIYDTAASSTLLDQLRDGLVVLVSVGVGIGAMLGAGAALAATDPPVGGEVLGLALLLSGLVVVFLPLYYVFPDAEVTVRDVLPGAVFAALSWVGLQAAFQVYAAAAPGYDVYGVIGGVLLLVTWFYVAAVALLVGAVLNLVLAGGTGNTKGLRRLSR